jgi:hypothetical protein
MMNEYALTSIKLVYLLFLITRTINGDVSFEMLKMFFYSLRDIVTSFIKMCISKFLLCCEAIIQTLLFL